MAAPSRRHFPETSTISRGGALTQLALFGAANPARLAGMSVDEVLRLYNVTKGQAQAAIVQAVGRANG